ncbi:MAG: OmpA family protein [Myxococcota bacterium]|nr:OmpA family protein [Myxococcota bacterium]MDW8362166.1 OmpA family protein [Myxococcales bacterium]
MGTRKMRRSLAALLAALLGTPAAASAQSGSASLEGGRVFDLHLLRPPLDSKGMLAINGTDILGAGDFSFGLVLDGGFGLLPFEGFVNNDSRRAADAERVNRLVESLFTGTLHFNYGIANTAVVGLQLPVQVISGENVTVPGLYNDSGRRGLDYQGLGELTLHGKVRITRVERHPVGLAALLNVELPTGSPETFAGDGLALWPQLALEWRPVRRLRFAVNAGYRLSLGDPVQGFPVGGRAEPSDPSQATNPRVTDEGNPLDYGHFVTFGAGLSLRLGEALEVGADLYGAQNVTAFGNPAGLSVEAIGGLKVFVERNSYLMIGGGVGLPTGGAQAADYRALLGFIFEPSIGDRDGDGYKDDADECPDEPEDFDDFADEEGCPDPDNDRDGILDVDDECPLVPEDRDGDADQDGCPEGNEGDRDGDGILDAADQCPDDPEDRDGFEDQEGCPDPDNDRDGILDVDDLCPNEPEDHDDFQDQDGCPDPDNDQDRILDVQDACPMDPETYNGFEDEDGCPDRGSVVIEENQILILEKIYFETDSAVIQPRSYAILDAVAATLNGNPHITLVEVQGHADERAPDDYNIRLTRDRAAAVLEALVQRGVARERMRSAGYGERCPVDPRSNPQAWERNRRVEFKILRTQDGPTGVEVACPAGRELIPE